jgi:secreted trypsin-like serine protease
MTAAHCTANLLPGYEIKVIYGAQYSKNDGKTIVSDRYVQNPEFTQSSMDGDMTLVHLPTPLVFDQKSVAPVCLPWSLRNETFDNVTALASGWGTTQPVPVGQTNTNQVSNTLMKVELPVLSSEHCQAQFPTLKYVTSNMLCTYLPGKDTCQGDSGGSIDYQPNQNGSFFGIGVVSFGEGCAQNDHPGVYTKVTNYLNWIQTTTGENYCQA